MVISSGATMQGDEINGTGEITTGITFLYYITTNSSKH